MTKITKIQYTSIRSYENLQDFVAVLMATFSHFASLFGDPMGPGEPEKRRELAQAVLAYPQCYEIKGRPELASKILRIVFSYLLEMKGGWGVDDSASKVEFQFGGEVTIVTPGKTEIKLWPTGSDLVLDVDFGPKGSEVRAASILAAAKAAGVPFSSIEYVEEEVATEGN